MGSSISTIADQSSNEDLSIERRQRLEAEIKRIRAERWYSNIVSEGLGLPVEYLHVLAPKEDDKMQANQEARE